MMDEWIRSGLDLILILLIGAGLVQATRLIWHLAGLRASRVEMEHFVRDFNSTVLRAEAGIKGLKIAARESGDDLEKLVEKSILVRDELHYIVESADHLADRLTKAASAIARPEAKTSEVKMAEIRSVSVSQVKPAAVATAPVPAPAIVVPSPQPIKSSAPIAEPPPALRKDQDTKPASRAEKELMQAMQKLN